MGDARFVLLGGASPGTHEFHRARTEITRRLIVEKGFRGVAVDADGPDARRVDRWVRGRSDDEDADVALGAFCRFPAWTWRNTDVLEFVAWLRRHNAAVHDERNAAGFWGLDLYGLNASMEIVLASLRRRDPDAARRAEARYACLDRFGGDAQGYGASGTFGLGVACDETVIRRLVEHAAEDLLQPAGRESLVAREAPAYYQAMFGSPVLPWNLRARQLAGTLDALSERLARDGGGAKLVVWAHNAQLGDARGTEMGEHGDLSLGQLVRARHGAEAVLVGFTSDSGTVTAASTWGGPARRRHLRPALAGTYERLFHDTAHPRFFLDLRPTELVLGSRLERAVGAVYRPESERRSHYFSARLPEQFDAILHFDETRAVEPLECTSLWMRGDAAEWGPKES